MVAAWVAAAVMVVYLSMVLSGRVVCQGSSRRGASGDGSTNRARASQVESHQFQRPRLVMYCEVGSETTSSSHARDIADG
jgi:hypothetical protein